VILPENAREFIDGLAVSRFFSVGPATQKRLETIGIRTGLDLRNAGPARMEKLLGRQGLFLHGLSTGIDEPPITATPEEAGTASPCQLAAVLKSAVTPFAKASANTMSYWPE